jgi:ribosomal protein L37E
MTATSPYRQPDPPLVPAAPSYVEHWREHEKRSRLVLVAWLGFPPAFGGACAVGIWLTNDPPFVPILCIFLYVIFFLLVSGRTTLMCPRCGRRFHSNGFHSNSWLGGCVHCGLPRGAPCDPDWKPSAD